MGLQIKNSGQGANWVRNNVFNDIYHATESIGKNRHPNYSVGSFIGLKYICNNFRTSDYAIFIDRDRTARNDWYGPDLNQNGGTITQSAENIFDRKELEASDIYVYDNSSVYTYTCYLGAETDPLSISSNILKNPATETIDCSNLYTSLDDVTLEHHYLTFEGDFINLLYNYNNLLDGGSTDLLLDKIQGSWSDEVWAIREEFISNSPYLSPEVLIELAISQILPLPIYLEVALSNPEATQKDGYLDFMKSDEGENLLTANGKEMIIDSWNTKTFRATMESNISSKLSNMEEITRTQIDRTINDSTGFILNNYRVLLDRIRNIDAKYELVDSYIETKEYNSARNLLNTLLADPDNEKYNSDDINDYLSLIDIMEDRNDSTNQIPIDERLEVLSQSTTRAGAKAKAYLNFNDDNTNYHPDYVTLEPNPKSKLIKTNTSFNLFTADITIVPNPAKNYITLTYNLQPKQTYTLKIYDNKGIELLSKTLNGNKGIQTIDLNNFKSGSYYYTITNSKSVIKSDKLIIAR